MPSTTDPNHGDSEPEYAEPITEYNVQSLLDSDPIIAIFPSGSEIIEDMTKKRYLSNLEARKNSGAGICVLWRMRIRATTASTSPNAQTESSRFRSISNRDKSAKSTSRSSGNFLGNYRKHKSTESIPPS